MIFRAGQFKFVFPGPTLVMGVVNVTPDSFSDGGRYLDSESAVDHALELVREGADIIDVGGESSRPQAEPVKVTTELGRVLPVLERLAPRLGVPISIDTQKLEVAQAALRAGASIVNDVAAARAAPALWQLVAETGAGYICMHSQGTPQTMQIDPHYENVVREVAAFFRERLEALRRAGVAPEQVALDPGVGFGKTVEHNLELLAGLESFKELERPVMVAASRKSFIGKLVGAEVGARLPASLACAVWAVAAGVQIIRTHDVGATRQAVRMAEALRAHVK